MQNVKSIALELKTLLQACCFESKASR